MESSSLKLASIICLILLLLAMPVSAENETVSVIIILQDQPIQRLHEKAMEKKALDIEPSETIIKNIAKRAQSRIKAKKKGKISVFREMKIDEKALLSNEVRKIRKLKGEARKDAIIETQKIISPIQDKLERRIQRLGGRVTGRGLFFNMLFADVPSSKITEIASFPVVLSVEVSQTYSPLLDVSTEAIYSDAFWNASHNGSGIAIAIVDTGVNASHPGISSRIVDAKDFVLTDSDGNSTDDPSGHGTHVAGIAASTDSTYKGVAFGASIINAKAYDSTSGLFADSDIMTAIDWAIYNATEGAEIISASFGADTIGYDPLSRFFDAVVDIGVFISVAAGNEGPSASTIGRPGTSYNSMTIGAIDDKNTVTRTDDSIWDNSSRGPITFSGKPIDRIKPDIVASGNGITSLSNSGAGFVTFSGTSMATPHVSGAAALLMSAGITDPRAVKALLINTAEDKGTEGVDDNYGWGYIDLNSTFYHLSDVRLATVNTSNEVLYFKGDATAGDKATIVWNRHNTYSGPDGDYSSSSGKIVSDLDFYLYSVSNGNEIKNSTRQYSNVEQVETNSSDTFVVKISVFSFFGVTSETFALATVEGFTQASPPGLNASLHIPEVIPFNKNVTVELNITNTGDINAHNVTAVLDLPVGLTLLSENQTEVGIIENDSTKSVNWTIQATLTGTYSLNARVNSSSYGETINANSSNTTSTESNPPIIVLTSPGNTTYYDNVSLNFTVDDESNVSSVWYNLNNGVNTTLLGNTTLLLCSNTYTLNFYANDTIGLINSPIIEFNVSRVQNLNNTMNYTSIQAAVDNASIGDTISVGCGNYSENVNLNKSINLIGAGADVTIINASNSSDHVFNISADGVNTTGFFLTGGLDTFKAGLYLGGTNINITRNHFSDNYYGVYVFNSSNNTLTYNNASNNNFGIYLLSSSNNTVYYNNLINNTNQSYDDGNNSWDDSYPGGGNFWSDWISPDINGDGVVDGSYNISEGNNQDRYPVIAKNGWLNIIEDTIPPNVTITSPENTSYNSTSISLKYSLSTDLISSTFYNINATANITLSGNTTLSNLEDGQYNLTIYSNDTFGNINSSIVWFIVDTTLPNVTNLTATPESPTKGSLINFTVNLSDQNSDTVLLKITYPNSTVKTETMSPGTPYYLQDFNASDFGTYIARVIANDTAGNVNNPVNTTFYVVSSYSNAANVTNGSTVAAINESDVIIEVTANETKNATVTLNVKLSSSSTSFRSEERRVGKECRSRWSPYH